MVTERTVFVHLLGVLGAILLAIVVACAWPARSFRDFVENLQGIFVGRLR